MQIEIVRYVDIQIDVVVYHVTIVAIGHGLLKKLWPMVFYILDGYVDRDRQKCRQRQLDMQIEIVRYVDRYSQICRQRQIDMQIEIDRYVDRDRQICRKNRQIDRDGQIYLTSLDPDSSPWPGRWRGGGCRACSGPASTGTGWPALPGSGSPNRIFSC